MQMQMPIRIMHKQIFCFFLSDAFHDLMNSQMFDGVTFGLNRLFLKELPFGTAFPN